MERRMLERVLGGWGFPYIGVLLLPFSYHIAFITATVPFCILFKVCSSIFFFHFRSGPGGEGQPMTPCSSSLTSKFLVHTFGILSQ